MNRNILLAVVSVLLGLVIIFAGYYFAVARPASERAALTLQQQQVAAQKAKAAADLAAAQAKQKQAEVEQQKADAAKAASDAVTDAKNKRSSYLAACHTRAEGVYWNYVKLNGTPVMGQPGVYNAPQYVWDRAKQEKQDKLDECFRLVDSGVNPDDLAATVAPNPVSDTTSQSLTLTPPSGTPLGDDMEAFARQYLANGERSDLNDAMTMYADQVDYYKAGVKPQSYLYADKSAYFKRWPVRTYTLDSAVTTTSDTGDTRQIRFDYTYYVEKADKSLSGRAYTVLDLERGNDGQFIITGEHGDVY